MTLKEFRECITIAAGLIKFEIKDYSPNLHKWNRNPVCDAVYVAIGESESWNDYREIFCPNRKENTQLWFGKLTLENVPLRLNSLRIFERIAIDEKLYLNY